jgi:hypothetical protein
MTDSKRRPVDCEDRSQFAPTYTATAKFRELLTADEDIWRIDAEDSSGDVPRDQDTWPQQQSSRQHWPVRLVALAGFASAVTGLIVALWNGDHETSGVGNKRDKASFMSRLSALIAGDSHQANSSAPRLVLTRAPGALRFGEAAALGLKVDGTVYRAQLVIGGFASGSLFSVGRSIGQSVWSVPATQIEAATITPPRGFVGSMDIAVTLMLADGNLADRETLRLEWQPRTSAWLPSGPSILRRIDAKELNVLLARGNTLVATGDLAAARLVLQRAAEAGNARAAFMLAETYDPIVLEKLGELGLASNVAMARIWYSKAKDLGSEGAPECLERLARRSD